MKISNENKLFSNSDDIYLPSTTGNKSDNFAKFFIESVGWHYYIIRPIRNLLFCDETRSAVDPAPRLNQKLHISTSQ